MGRPGEARGQRGSDLTSRQVNLALEVGVMGAITTGLLSWSSGDRWNGWLTAAHGIIGLTLLLLVPAKLHGSVRSGFRRGRATRWISAVFGVLVLATAGLGLLHATGLWFGVGHWTALWTHELFGFVVIPFFVWHLVTRPVRPKARDLDRRAVLRLGLLGGVAFGVHLAQDPLTRGVGLAGGHRRQTGSHEVASHDPARMPTVIWLNDSRPADTEPSTWPLAIQRRAVTIESLWERSQPVVAALDCTGGWWSEQSWDVVPLSLLVREPSGRSVCVRSATGYARLFPRGDLDRIYLAVGYGGQPLRSGHGAPARLVVPGRRGPEWIKWVTSIDDDSRPSWLQPPLPLS